MKETTIYIETPLTDKVLEGLEDKKSYFVFTGNGYKFSDYGHQLKINGISFSDYIILLPLTVTSDMVEKEATTQSESYANVGVAKGCFKSAINWLLNINKEDKT